RGVTAHQIKRSFADTDPAHAVMNPAWSKPLLRDRKALAFPAEQVALRNPTVFVSDFSVTRVIAAFVAHDADVAHELETRRRYWHDDLARTLVTTGRVAISNRHHDREARAVRRRREPLVTIDHVVAAVFHGSGAHPGRVRAGMFGLSHRETTAHFAAREW